MMSDITDEKRVFDAVAEAETVPSETRWTPVERSAAGREITARWVPGARGGARWRIELEGDDPVTQADGAEHAGERIGLESTERARVDARVAAAVAESWTFGCICEAANEADAVERWRAGKWPKEIPGQLGRQLAVLRGRLVDQRDQGSQREQTLRVRRSIERVVVELYSLSVGALVSLERIRRGD